MTARRRPLSRLRVAAVTAVVVTAVVAGAADHRSAGIASAAPPPTKTAPSAPLTKTAPSAQNAKPGDEKKKSKILQAGDIAPDGKECVGSQHTTLGRVADMMIDGIAAILPADMRGQAPVWKANAQRDLKNARVQMLSVSGPTSALSDNEDAPVHKYRDPISQMIVTQLMNVREGKAHKSITVQNLSLAQAVETVYFYAYVTVIVPLTLLRRTIGPIGQIGPVSIGMAVSIPILLGVLGVNLVYQAMSKALIKACMTTVTPEEKASVGQPNLPGGSPSDIPAVFREIASQVMIADPTTCPAIGEMPLSRVASRTVEYMLATNKNPAARAQISRVAKDLNRVMRTTWAPVGAIPADPADFTTIESVTSSLMTLIPYIGGAPTDMAIGWKHNLDNGKNPGKMVPLADVTVTKSLTAAYYAWAMSAHIASEVWSSAGSDGAASIINGLLPAGTDVTPLMPRTGGILNAPNLYGLVVFHNVLRSVCLASDNTAAAADEAVAVRSNPAARRW